MPISRFNLSAPSNDTTSIADFVQQVIFAAIENGASDIHFESQPKKMKIRFRIDGMLYDACEPEKSIAPSITSFLKIKANLDIAEKRLPQDGRYAITTRNQKLYICRLSTLPTLHGEKIVLRLLHTNTNQLTIENLAFESWQQKIFLQNITKPQGLILITGPTGSGKTTTLYTALSAVNTAEKNITTIEDPIEIELENVNQLNVNPKIGLSFNHALRALLRQDPDIIMIGEIRDSETAIMAVNAAQTGHLVFATLHTNNAVESLTRLSMMGLSTIDLVETLNLIIAQRLTRKLCAYCKIPTTLPPYILQKSGLNASNAHYFQATGCQRCIQGFDGRIAVYQFFEFNHFIKSVMLQGASPNQLAKEAQLMTLWDAGLVKVITGITSLSELHRTIGQR